MAEGYRARLANRAPLVPQGQVDPRGLAVIGGLAGVAQTIRQEHRANEQLDVELQEREAARQRNRASVAFQAKMTRLEIAAEERVAALREARDMQPGAAGHGDRVAAEIGALYDEAEAELGPDEKMQMHFLPILDRMRAQAIHREREWERGESAKWSASVEDETRSVAENRVRANPTEQAHADAEKDLIGRMELRDLPATTKAIYTKHALARLADARLSGLTESGNPQEAIKLIESGRFDLLDPKRLAGLRGEAEAEIARQARAAETARVAAETQVKASIGEAVKAVNDRAPYDDAQLALLEQQGVDAGMDDNELYAIREARVTNRVRRQYADALPQAMQNDLNDMNAKIAKQGDKAPRALVQARNALEAEVKARRAEWKANPMEAAAKIGMTVPRIDWNAPTRAQGRAREALSSKIDDLPGVGGGVHNPLTTDEVAMFQGMLGRGIEGDRQILDKLDAVFGPAYRREAARQIEPGDAQFQALATLPARYREMAWRGREATKKNDAILRSDKVKVEGALDAAERRWNRATVGIEKDQRTALREIANQIAAGYVERDGSEISGDLMMIAMDQALGGSGSGNDKVGGIAPWGRGGSYVLPPTVSRRAFINGVTAFARGKPGDAPVNVDGSLADLNAATPVMIESGVYEFRSANGRPVKRRGGGNFTFRIGG